MGRFKADKLEWQNRIFDPEELISWGFTCAPKYPEIASDIAAHVLNEAFLSKDKDLFKAGNELMRAAEHPRVFVASESSKQATADNNRPSESPVPKLHPALCDKNIIEDKDWDDSLDDVFNKKVKPQEIKKALETLTSTTLSEEKRRFVYYKVLVYIRYIPTEKRGSKKNFLKWWNLHFNCNWVKTETSDPFKFRINSRLMNSQPYEWNKIDMDNANDYYDFAKTVKNTFTQTVINNEAQDGQDFNAGPLFDRGQFLKDTQKPINNGRTYFKT